MRFKVTKIVQESPEGSGIYTCTVMAIAEDGEASGAGHASDTCTVGSRIAAEMIVRRMQAALAAKMLGQGHEVHLERDEYAS